GKPHHTLLHIGNKENAPTARGQQGSYSKQVQANISTKGFSTVILPTAKILIEDGNEELIPYRAILDSGSQSTFISEKAVQYLGLKRISYSVGITGIGDEDTCTTKGYVNLTVSSTMDP